MKGLIVIALCLWPLAALSQQAPSFSPPGELESGSGRGVADPNVYLRDIRFPIEKAPAFLNSQVYRKGGMHGPSGGQCDSANYSYPWRDNFCEKRDWGMPLCPAGKGHQGQDIRPATCKAGLHWAVAAESGKIVQIGNAALEGATIALVSLSRRQEIEAIVRRVEHCRLETHPAFFDYFVDGCQFRPVESATRVSG